MNSISILKTLFALTSMVLFKAAGADNFVLFMLGCGAMGLYGAFCSEQEEIKS